MGWAECPGTHQSDWPSYQIDKYPHWSQSTAQVHHTMKKMFVVTLYM